MPAKNQNIPKWALYLAAGVAALALIGVAVVAVVTAKTAGKSKAASSAEITPDTTATTVPDESAPETTQAVAPEATTTAPPKETAPQRITVTRESGESYCLVDKVLEEDGKDLVTLDYIQLGTEDHGSEDYDVINDDKKLKTFELTGDSWIGAYWLCADLYGQSVTDKFDFEGGPVGRGYPLKRTDFERVVKQGQGNEHSYWYVQVKDGRVISLVQTYQD